MGATHFNRVAADAEYPAGQELLSEIDRSSRPPTRSAAPNIVMGAKTIASRTRQAEQARLGEMLSAAPAPGLDWDALVAEGQEWHDRLVTGDLTPAEASESRDWVAAWVEEVIVQPAVKRGQRFDPKRVTIRWRKLMRVAG